MDRGVRTSCLILLLRLCLVIGPTSVSAGAAERANLGRDGLALAGYDPVSYFSKSGPQKGKAANEVQFEGIRYWFADSQNQQAFQAEPVRYLPEFGGWCAWAMLDGETVDVNPRSYRIYDGRLLLFYDGFWGDTRKRWNKRAEESGETQLYEIAETNWRAVARDD